MKVSERLVLYGEDTLSSRELLTALFGKQTAEGLFNNHESLMSIAGASMRELARIKGVGPIRVAAIKALFEIARRLPLEEIKKGMPIRNPQDLTDIFLSSMRSLKIEVFYAVLLDGRNNLICHREIASGTPTQAVPHVSTILDFALEQKASGIACVHNHPSGTTTPSREDRRFTEALRAGVDACDMTLVDHIIIGDNSFFSFAEGGDL